jgi:hypothetical protein
LTSITTQINTKFKTNISIRDIAQKNNISDPNKIYAGDYIVLPGENPELSFDLKSLYVFDTFYEQSVPLYQWAGTSGREGYQFPEFQNLQGKGPLPEGLYLVDPAQTQHYRDTSFWDRVLGLIGRGTWRGGTHTWGEHRTWLQPINVPNLYNRSKFSIHGGDVPGSAGCIDLTGANNSFHNWLSNYGKPVYLRIKY